MQFSSRTEAGRQLAARLHHLRAAKPVVLALPRGGVPVAIPIAEALDAPLDLLLVRKMGAPGQPELAIGAVVEGTPPQTVLNDRIVAALGVPAGYIADRTAALAADIARMRQRWLAGRAALPLQGRAVVVVDDGIATGATMRATLLALARAGAGQRILAAPVVPPEAAGMLRTLCDEAVFLLEPPGFGAVGAYYEDFRQVADAEVTALLAAAAGRRPA